MRKLILGTLALAVLAIPVQAATRLVAGDMKGVKLKQGGRIAIRNDSKSITAYQLTGEIRRALLSLKASPIRTSRILGTTRNGSAPLSEGIVPHYLQQMIADAGRQHGVDPRLVAAVARRESAFNPNALSPVGAQGLMQLMPATAKWLGVSNSYDAQQNVLGGAKYLRMLLDTFNGDLDLTLAAYNAGPGAVQKYRGIPPYRETKNYVTAVRTSYEKSLAAK